MNDKDLIGQKFSRLTVIRRADVSQFGNHKLICRCDCGNEKIVYEYNLTSGKTRSCGCLQQESRYTKVDDLMGKKFGLLTVVQRVSNKGKQVRYLCKCDCGNEKIFYSTNLKRGLSTSCGCYRAEKAKELLFQDLTGQRFGKLTVLCMDHYENKNNNYFWKCICECGTETITTSAHLKSGHTSSCGCIMSLGEAKIVGLLTEHNIEFKKNISHGLILPTGGKARYDFSIYDNDGNLKYLIEYDGLQHYSYFENSAWDKNGKFEIRQDSDKLKNEWCIENNIPLIRIPFSQYKNLCIDDLRLETTKYLITKELEINK